MRRVPWRLSVKVSRKTAVTVLGIALGVAFALVSFSIATGLERETLSIARNHPPRALLVSDDGLAPLPEGSLDLHPTLVGVLIGEAETADGVRVPVVALVGHTAPHLAPSVAFGPKTGTLTISGSGVVLNVTGPATDPHVPPGWYHVPSGALPAREGVADFALILDPIPTERDTLERSGLQVRGAPALQSFFSVSGTEIARDLYLVVVFSSALAVLFCYEFLRSEVREARREIGIWRAVGMRARDVLAIFLLRSAAIGAAALWIGWGMSFVLLGIAHERTGEAALRFALPPAEAIALSAAFVGATVLGGLLPALAASRITVQRSLESSP